MDAMKVLRGARGPLVRTRASAPGWGLVHIAGRDHLVRATREGPTIVLAPADFLLRELGDDDDGSDPEAPERVPAGAAVTAMVADQAVRHEREVFPPVSGKKLRNAIEQKRRVLAVQRGGAEVCLLADRPDEPRQLLAVSAPMAAAVAVRDRAQGRGYRVRSLTTAAAALAAVLRAADPDGDGDGATTAVHVSETIGTVACIQNGRLLLAREFRIPRPDEEAGVPTLGAPRIDHITGEVARSQLFFNHELHGLHQRRILVSGDVDGLDGLVEECRARFESPVEAMVDALALDLTPFGPGDAGRRRALRWSGAIALAVAGLGEGPRIDLLPSADRTHRQLRRTVATWTAVFGLAGAALVAGQMWLLGQGHAAHADLEAARARFEAIEDEVTHLEDIRDARDAAARIQQFLDGRRASIRITEEAVRALSIAAPDSLLLERFRLECGFAGAAAGRELTVEVAGEVTGVDAAAAQHDFNRFVHDLRNTTLFQEAALEPFESGPRSGHGGAALRFQLRSRIAG